MSAAKVILSLLCCLLCTIASASAAEILYDNPLPGTAYPIAITLPPVSYGTIVASVDGSAMVNGGTIISSIGSFNLEAGNFGVGVNPVNASGLHIWIAGANIQTSGESPLIPGNQYTIVATINRVHLSLYVCSPQCLKTYTVERSPLALGSAAYIGGAGGGYRTCACHIWGVQAWTPLSDNQVQALAWAAPSDPYPKATPTPIPTITPTAAPTPTTSPGGLIGCAGVTSYASGQYPVYSACYGNSPFHHFVATMLADGFASIQSSSIARNFYNEGWSGVNGSLDGNQSGGVGPLYFVTAAQQGRTVTCSDGGSYCDGTMYVPDGAYAETGTDHHLSSFDAIRGQEVDAWGYATGCTIGSSINCSSATSYSFGGSGIHTSPDWGGDAGGYAFGIADVSAQDILNYVYSGTHIGHALGIESGCVGPGAGIYPDAGQQPDSNCSDQQIVYGGGLHLKSSIYVPSLTSDRYCQAVLYALQDYGAFEMDTTGNSTGIYVNFEYPNAYDVAPWSSNPWPSILNNSTIMSTDGCLSYITSVNDVEVFYDNGKLPPYYGYGSPLN